MPIARSNGAEIYYEEHGQGVPLILSHGGWNDTSHFEANQAALSQDHRLVLYDRRGCGRSRATEGATSTPVLVEDLYQLMRYLGIDKGCVGGVSYGAMLTLELALAHPEVVTAAVLVSGTARGLSGSGERAIPFPNRVAELGRIQCPTLIVHGDADYVFPPEMAEEMGRGISNSKVVIMRGASHSLHRERPQEFNNAVRDFLAAVAARGEG